MTIICSVSAKKHFFVIDSVANETVQELTQNGGHLLGASQLQALEAVVTEKAESNKEYIGKDALTILKAAGITAPAETVAIVVEVPADHGFVINEYLMPILPVVRCRDFGRGVGRRSQSRRRTWAHRSAPHKQHQTYHAVHKDNGL